MDQQTAGRVRLSRGELLAIFTFWTVMAALSALGAYIDPRGRMSQPGPLLGALPVPFIQYYLWALLTPLIFRLASTVELERPPRTARLLLLLAAGVIIAMAVDVALTFVRFELLGARPRPRPFGPPPPGPFAGILRFWFLDDFVLYLAVLGAGLAREYSTRLRRRHEEAVRLEAEAARLAAQLAQARITALRTQLNPHFLFNTLHAVSSLVERDPKGVRRMIARLSELLRHTLEGEDIQETPLARELELVGRYLEILQVRFQGQLAVSTAVPPELLDALVPNLRLQPLVEKAGRHGLSERPEGGHIRLSARREGGTLVLRVSDDGPGLPADAAEGVGLRNTRERLAALYGTDQRLVLGNAPEGGAFAEVHLPYHTAADLRPAAMPE